jgi:hypothetical protein
MPTTQQHTPDTSWEFSRNAIWDEASCVVLTKCACGKELQLAAPEEPSQLALMLAGRFGCDECAEGE